MLDTKPEWLLMDGDRVLLELRYVGGPDPQQGFLEYDVRFVGITEQEWQRTTLETDSRDLPWVWFSEEGQETRYFFEFTPHWIASERLMKFKCHEVDGPSCEDVYRRSGLGEGIQLPQRAPLVDPRPRIELERDLTSGDSVIVNTALLAVPYVSRHELQWAHQVLIERSKDPTYRSLALSGFGELARFHGWVDRKLVVPILQNALADPKFSFWAKDALANVERFSPAPR